MSPAKVRSLWDDIPDAWQRGIRIGVMIAGAVGFLATGTRLDALMGKDLTPRVMSIEAAMDTFRTESNRVSRGVEFMICRDQRREKSLSLDYCDYLWNPTDFLPPGRP